MELYDIFLQHPVICIDSRTCPQGSLFFALKGDNFNANAFALAALNQGCAYAVIDEPEYALDHRFIVVNNVLLALQELAQYHRKQLGTTIIGITGTNGKTTTKELIAAVLKEKFNILFTQGNLNNHIGVPLTLLQLKAEHELAVIEMGANHQGEIKILSEICYPDYGIITNVGKAHLEGFGSFEGVMKTKAELYQHIAVSGKKIFINNDNEFLKTMAANTGFHSTEKTVSYGLTSEDSDIRGQIVSCSPFLAMNFSTITTAHTDISTQLIGSYNAENVLAAICIGNYFGLTNQQIKKGLESYYPQNNRSQLTVTEHNKLVVDAYNANPTSMRAAIINFAQMQVPSKTLILGDMLELGKQSSEEHQHIIELLQLNNFENVMLVGPEFQKTKNNYKCFSNVAALHAYINENNIQHNYILIKGSRGIKLEQVISAL